MGIPWRPGGGTFAPPPPPAPLPAAEASDSEDWVVVGFLGADVLAGPVGSCPCPSCLVRWRFERAGISMPASRHA